MNIEQIKEQFFEHDLRCEEMHPLFMTPITALSGRLSEVILEDYFYETTEAMGLSEEERQILNDRDDLEELLFAKQLDGFLARFAKPIAFGFGTNGGYSSSWGYYRTQWFYAGSIPELAQKALNWSEEVFEIDMGRTKP